MNDTDNGNYPYLVRKLEAVAKGLDCSAKMHLDAYDNGLKKHAAQNWGSYVAFDMAAKEIREALNGGPEGFN